MKYSIVFIIFVFCSFSMKAQMTLDELLKENNKNPIAYISVDELHEKQQDEQVLLLDCRELSEFNVSRIDSATYVGYNDFSKKELKNLVPDKNANIVVYCSIGVRSDRIGKKLKKMGYTNVKNLFGGIFEWKNNNKPIVDSTNTETERIHVYSKEWGIWSHKGEKVYE